MTVGPGGSAEGSGPPQPNASIKQGSTDLSIRQATRVVSPGSTGVPGKAHPEDHRRRNGANPSGPGRDRDVQRGFRALFLAGIAIILLFCASIALSVFLVTQP